MPYKLIYANVRLCDNAMSINDSKLSHVTSQVTDDMMHLVNDSMCDNNRRIIVSI